MRIEEYICPKGCIITDKNYDTCPKCGGFMKEIKDEESKKSMLADIQQYQRENALDASQGRYVGNKSIL